MKSHDEDVPATHDEIQWEQDRQTTLRTFEVELLDGSKRHVFAHFWSDENPAGHLHFCTLQPSGRLLIHDIINARAFIGVTEVTPPNVRKQIDRIAARQQAFHRGQKAMESMKRPDFRVH